MKISDTDYYRTRAADARRIAALALERSSIEVYAQMAARYDELADAMAIQGAAGA